MDAILTPLNDGVFSVTIGGKEYRLIPTDKIHKTLDGPVQNCTAARNTADLFSPIPARILYDYDGRARTLILEGAAYTIRMRGGYRPQAGRKKAPHRSINKSVTLTKDEWAYLQKLSEGETVVKQAAKILKEYISEHRQKESPNLPSLEK